MIFIAIADDHPIFRKGLIDVLSGYDDLKVVIDAPNGKELIKAIGAAETPPDICILDINMPEMNGFETAAYLKQYYPKMKLLALSMHNNELHIIKMFRNGANGYLLKDDEPDKIRQAVVEIHQQGFYLSGISPARIMSMLSGKIDPPGLDLSPKEEQFLSLCCTELTYREIAELMSLSPRTIDGYREAMFDKLQVTTRVGLVLYAIKEGLVDLKTISSAPFVKNENG